MPNASSFQCERDAFHLLGNKPGLVQYFGSFMTHNEDSSLPPTYNILLEYAESDLDEFFAHKFPPVATADIYNFWDAMLALVVTVRDIHDPIENGNWIG